MYNNISIQYSQICNHVVIIFWGHCESVNNIHITLLPSRTIRGAKSILLDFLWNDRNLLLICQVSEIFPWLSVKTKMHLNLYFILDYVTNFLKYKRLFCFFDILYSITIKCNHSSIIYKCFIYIVSFSNCILL